MWGTNLYFFDIFLFVLYRKDIFIQFFNRNRCNVVMTCSKWEKGEKPTQDKQKEEVPNYAVTYILSNSSKVSSQTPDLILHWVVCVCVWRDVWAANVQPWPSADAVLSFTCSGFPFEEFQLLTLPHLSPCDLLTSICCCKSWEIIQIYLMNSINE